MRAHNDLIAAFGLRGWVHRCLLGALGQAGDGAIASTAGSRRGVLERGGPPPLLPPAAQSVSGIIEPAIARDSGQLFPKIRANSRNSRKASSGCFISFHSCPSVVELFFSWLT